MNNKTTVILTEVRENTPWWDFVLVSFRLVLVTDYASVTLCFSIIYEALHGSSMQLCERIISNCYEIDAKSTETRRCYRISVSVKTPTFCRSIFSLLTVKSETMPTIVLYSTSGARGRTRIRASKFIPITTGC